MEFSIQINILGEFAVLNAAGLPVKFHSKLERQLVAYVCFYDSLHDRDDLASIFWAVESRAGGRKNLSQLLWRVSQSLGQDVFASDRDSIQLEVSKVQVDLAEARQALGRIAEQHDPQLAKSIINASQLELLKGFTDDWVFEARDQWQVELTAGLRKLEHLAESAGAFEDMIQLARAQIRLDPLNERANAAVIRTCLVLGRSSEARDHFEHYKQALKDIGEVVSGKMRVLAERIQSGQSMSNIVPRASLEIGLGLPIIGRSFERERCLKALSEAKQGTGRIVLIEGEPGIGKTRLLQSLADDATWRGQNVLRATAQEFHQLEPYLVIQEMLIDNLGSLRLEVLRSQIDAMWLQEAARVIPKLGTIKTFKLAVDGNYDLQRLRESLIEIIKTLSKIQPIAIVIDDLQWADDASLELLLGLARTLESLPIALVIGFRSFEARENPRVWQCIETLDHNSFTIRVQLEALTRDKIKQLAQKALGIDILPEVATHFESVSQGNPLLMLEILKVLLETGLALEDQQQWINHLQNMPLTGLHEVIQSRLAKLDAQSLDVLHLTAAIGSSFEFEVLQDLTQIPSLELLDTLDALIRAGFLREVEPGFGFAHDQLRQTIYAQLPETKQIQLHARILKTLEARASEIPEVLANHAERSKQLLLANHYRLRSAEHSLELHGYAQALTYLEAIGDEGLRQFMGNEQIRFLEARIRADGVQNNAKRVLEDLNALEEHLKDQPFKRLELLTRRAKTLSTLGRTPEALTLIEAASQIAREAQVIDQVRVLICHGSIYLAGGGPFDAALAPLEKAVRLCVQFELPLEAEARGNLGLALTYLGRFEPALQELQSALVMSQQTNDIFKQVSLNGTIASLHMKHSYFQESIPFLEHAITLSSRIGLRQEQALNLANLGLVSFQLGKLEKGFECYERALEICLETGAKSLEGHILAVTAFYKYLHLDTKLVVQQLNKALKIQTELNAHSRQCFILTQLGLLYFWCQDFEESQHYFAQAIQLGTEIKDTHGELFATMWLIEIKILLQLHVEAKYLATLGLQSALENQFPNEQLQYKRLLATIEYQNQNFLAALEIIQECLPETGSYVGVKIYGFYAFHLLHFKILRALQLESEALAALALARKYLEIEFQNYPVSQHAGLRNAIPVIHEIMNLVEQLLEHSLSVQLASKDAPIGRSLQAHEYCSVTWTIHTPEDDQILDKTKRRQHQLERLCSQALSQGGAPTVEDLARALNSSVATIKRDLAVLRASGQNLNTRGARATTSNLQNGISHALKLV